MIHDEGPGQKRLKSIDTSTLAITNICDLGVQFHNGGMAYDPNSDTLYMVDGSTFGNFNNLYMVNRTTGAASVVGNHGLTFLGGLAFDSTNNVLYGSRTESPDGTQGGNELYRLDTGTASTTFIGNTIAPFSGLGYDSIRDQLFGVDDNADSIFAIDRSNGESDNGAIAGFPHSVTSFGFAYDPDLDRFWQTDEAGSLYSWDVPIANPTTHFLNTLPRLDNLAYASQPPAVPIPNTIWLFGTGLGGLVAFRRWQTQVRRT